MKRKCKMIFVGAILFSLLFSGVVIAGNAPAWPDTVNMKVASVMHSINMIDMETFKGVVDHNKTDMIIDVREPNEYAAGHVPGAINIPRGLIEFKIWKKVGFPEHADIDKKMYIYCKTGGRAALSTKALVELGFTNLTAVKMQIADWEKAGYPVEK